MSGHCDFCGIWHSGSCCHPGRAIVADLERRLGEADERFKTWQQIAADKTLAHDKALAWKDRIIDALVVAFIYQREHEDNPELALNTLIQWETMVALDPAVSSSAQALVDKGEAKALARVRELEGALEFYADRETWLPGNEYHAVFVDRGAKARAALQEKPVKEAPYSLNDLRERYD